MSLTLSRKTYLQLVSEAILSLKERNGSSKPAINNWINQNYPDVDLSPQFLKAALKRGVESEKLVQVKSSWKLGRSHRQSTIKLVEKEADKKKVLEEKKKVVSEKVVSKKPTSISAKANKKVTPSSKSPTKRVGAKPLPKVKRATKKSSRKV